MSEVQIVYLVLFTSKEKMENNEQELISLRACMAKEEYKEEDFNFFLTDNVNVKKYNLSDSLNYDSIIWVKELEEKRPLWAEFLDKLNGNPIENLKSMSSSAVVFVRVPQIGIVIFLFGYGRHLINQGYVQGDFGIKTALNCLDHKTLRSIDSLSLDEQAVQKRTQASRYSNINTFGIDVSKDILRSVTGLPKENVNFYSISGGDAFFGFSKKLGASDLLETAKELISYYNQDAYKENFEWIDNIRRIKKDEVLEILNARLFEKVKSKNKDDIYLNIPEIVSWDRIDGFSFTRAKYKMSPNLDITNYYESFESVEYTEERLKRDQVFIIESNNNFEKYPVYRCIYAELKEIDKVYIYFNAEWYEIDNDFIKNIDRAVMAINHSEIDFPKVLKIEHVGDNISKFLIESEGDYNIRAAKKTNSINLDKKLIRTRMASSPIEICDLLTDKKQLIHVKHKKGGSAGLSHLFSQGYVSAETLLSDRGFRKSARVKLREIDADLALIPLDKFKGQDYEIVFLVLGEEGDVRGALPFFSKVNLFRTNRELTQRGFKVSLAGVGFEVKRK